MARARVRSGGFEISAELQGFDEAEKEFRQVRARLARGIDDEARQAAEITILPTARTRAGSLKVDGASIAESLVVRRIRGGARLTSKLRGVRARAVGLLEFGGTVREAITPHNKKALMIPGSGHPIARVGTARHYRARKFMTGARDDRLPAFADELRDRLVEFFRVAGFEVR